LGSHFLMIKMTPFNLLKSDKQHTLSDILADIKFNLLIL